MEQEPFMWRSISFGCRALDQLLDGGLPRRGITEIFGESASGKSQLCMQLAVTAQLPPYFGGTQKGVVFFTTTGGLFPSGRLHAIIDTFQKRHPDLPIDYMRNIFIQSRMEISGLMHCIEKEFPNFLQTHQIGLVILDSMGIFRSEKNGVSRSKTMRRFGMILRELSAKHEFAILCVNEVVSVPGLDTVVPSLGLSWANLITTRLKVSRTDRKTPEGDVIRTLSTMHAPETSIDSAEFIVNSQGVCDL